MPAERLLEAQGGAPELFAAVEAKRAMYELTNAALITIDVQADTLDGQSLEVPGTTAVLPQLAGLCAAFRRSGLPIVHVLRLYLADGSNAEPLRRDVARSRPVFRPGTPGRRLAPELVPADAPELDDGRLLDGELQVLGPAELAMYKPRYRAPSTRLRSTTTCRDWA